MFIYEVVVGEYEYQRKYLLSHDKEYSKEEFIKIMQGATRYFQKRNPEENCLDDSDVLDVLKDVYEFKEYKVKIQTNIFLDWSIDQVLNC